MSHLNEVAIDKVFRLLPSGQEQQAEIGVGQRLFFFCAVAAARKRSQSERDLQMCMKLIDEARLRSCRSEPGIQSASARPSKKKWVIRET